MSIEIHKKHPLYEYIQHSIVHFEERLFLIRDMNEQNIIFMPLSVKGKKLKFALILSIGYHVYIASLEKNAFYSLKLTAPTTFELDFIDDIFKNYEMYLRELLKHYGK